MEAQTSPPNETGIRPPGGLITLNELKAHRVGQKNANMIVTVYCYLAEELKSSAPFDLPEIDFQTGGKINLLVQSVSTYEKDRIDDAANNLLLFNNYGRGGKI